MNASQLETLHAGRYLSLVRRGHWEFATRHGATGVVGLIAVTNEAKMLLVEQLRPPLGKRVLELPAGLSGDIPGEEAESLVRAAARVAGRDGLRSSRGPVAHGRAEFRRIDRRDDLIFSDDRPHKNGRRGR